MSAQRELAASKVRPGPAGYSAGERAGRARISRAGKSGDTIQARPLLFSSCVQFRSSSTFFILTAFSVSTGPHLIYIMVSSLSPFNSASFYIYGTIQVYSLCRYASSDARVERDRKSTRLNSSHCVTSRMPSSA